jgi:hypothetical protein
MEADWRLSTNGSHFCGDGIYCRAGDPEAG